MSAGTNRIITPLILAFILATTAPTFAGQIIYVDDDAPADFNNIQEAIDNSNQGDTIIVSPGTYTGEGNRDIDFLGKAITVRSIDPNDPNIVAATIIDCNGTGYEPHRGFYFHSGENANSILDGLTITNGYAKYGGGIYCFGSKPMINNCIITGNSAVSGGGIRGDSVISNCTILDNSATNGGGILNSSIITHCIIMNNSATYGGGGIFSSYSSNTKIKNCIITGNSANSGGGIHGWRSSLMITNCTVAENSANRGGGIDCGALSTAVVSHCILWGNTAPNGPEISLRITSAPSHLTVSYSNVQGGQENSYIEYNCTLDWDEWNIDANPLFVAPVDDDYHLSVNSPCIDAGDPDYGSAIEEADIDGEPRLMGIRLDIGADESTFTTETPKIGYSLSRYKLTSYEGGPNPESQLLFIRNTGIGILNWQVTEECLWVEVSPASGESIGEVDKLSLSPDISGLYPGLYTCELMITANEALNSPQMIAVTLYIGEGELHVPAEYPTIQAAIDEAVDGETIVVADGTYTGEGNRDIDFKGKEITVQSQSGPENCIIDCQKSGGGFFLHSGETPNSVIDGFSITNAHWSAISCREGSPTIANCNISNSWGDRGGGIDCRDNSCPTITNCTITGCIAGLGGGIACRSGSDVTINRCAIIGNLGGDAAGGIWCTSSTANLTNCIVIGNIGAQNGGGISCREATLTAANCTFADNSAPVGNFLGCVFWGDYRSYVTLSNCIIRNGGDEIFNVNNSVITINYSNIQNGWPGEDNIDADPCFVDLGYWDFNDTPQNTRDDVWIEGDYHLLPTSTCIDTGDPDYVPGPNETDLDGNPRVKWGRIDMGAYEFIPLAAEVRIVPHTINLTNKGNWITAFLWLPEEYNVADLDPNSVFLEDEIQPEQLFINEKEQVAIAKFSREQVQGILIIGEVELLITVQLTDGYAFEGTDVIKVIHEGGRKLSKFDKALNPNPADSATDVDTSADLSWTAGYGATSHDVYFGTGSTPPFVCNQTAATFDPGTMATGTRYYWRIDEVNKWGKTTGDLWSFTTYGPPPPPPPPPPPQPPM